MGALTSFKKCFQNVQFKKSEYIISCDDQLILAGDYLDRGPKILELLRWLTKRPQNVQCIRGNHEEAFLADIALMRQFNSSEHLCTNLNSHTETASLYSSVKFALLSGNFTTGHTFDAYHTIGDLLLGSGITMAELLSWASVITAMPYYLKLSVNGRSCVMVHAGYQDEEFSSDQEATRFYLWARQESIEQGGMAHGMVIAGHTPTIFPNTFCWNNGRVFRHYKQELDCIYYDIDCGCAYRKQYPNARLASIRLEDERIFYV